MSMTSGLRLKSDFPEAARESDGSKHRPGFIRSVSSPVRLQSVLEPFVRQTPSLLGRHYSTDWNISRAAPPIHMHFITEEQHCTSREADVVPPAVRGDAKVNHALARQERVVFHSESHWVAAVTADGVDCRVLMQRRRNAQRIPDADCRVGHAPGLDAKAGRHGAEGSGGPDSSVVRREDED